MPGQTVLPEVIHQRDSREDIPEWAEKLYYDRGLFSEVLVYHDDEAIYFEVRGEDSGIVRFTFEMLESLRKLRVEAQQEAGVREGTRRRRDIDEE